MPSTRFPSKVDRWLVVVLIGAAGLVLWSVASAVRDGLNGADAIALGLAVLVGVALPVWMLLQTDYRVEAGRLRVRCGPFRWSVALDEIESLRPTRNPLSSPALSLDRLELRYRNGKRLLLSPADKRGFIEALRLK